MCKVDTPTVKAAVPPKAGSAAPELASTDEVTDDMSLSKKLGLDRLRIDRTTPAASLPSSGAGVQSGA